MTLRQTMIISAALAGSLALQGCAGIGLTLLGVGAGTAAGAGVDHTLSGIATKTFNAPADRLHDATRRALADMAIPVREDARSDTGYHLVGTAADREIDVELERLTPRMTRMRVVASQGPFFKDRATATELILVTADRLDVRLAKR
jgi:hypothetical protein